MGRFKDGQLSQFLQGQGLASDFVWSLLAEEDGTVWIGTYGSGLCRFKNGRFTTVSSRNGLPSDVICSILDDQDGYLWFSSYAGVFRASKAALSQCAEGQTRSVDCLAFGFAEGLTSLEMSGGCQPASCRTADGRLWYPSSKGLAMIDPGAIRNNAVPPPVVVQEILVDGELVNAGAAEDKTPDPAVQIRPGHRHLEFRYAGLSFTAPERVRFRYRMEGLEKEWIEAGNRRSANYGYLPPGSYTFRVLACNNNGVWSGTGAAQSVTVLPYFWQTLWFQGGSGLGAMAVAACSTAVLARRRQRRKVADLERQRASEQERTRIARDIHDQLGIGLTRISMLSLSVTAQVPQPSRIRENVQEIYQTTNELTRSMDEIVWAVNPRHDTLDSLLTYLGGFARKFLETAEIRCRLDLPMEVPSCVLSADLRHNLFLAFKEVLNNAVKHAAASEVRIAGRVRATEFVLTVEDNGIGFVLTPPQTAGNGLTNLQQRLREVGGQFACESGIGVGTTVRLTFPIQL